MNEEMNNNPKRIISLIPFIAILWICVIVFGFTIYKMSQNEKNEKATYMAIVDTYGDEITAAIEEYMKNNNGKVPSWEDIEDNIATLKDKIYCTTKINYDGTVYLKNCNVVDIDYVDHYYTYGKNLPDPVKVDHELYIYSHSYNNGSEYLNISNNKYNDSNYKLIKTYECNKNNCRGYDADSDNKLAIIFDDNNYYLYNYINDSKEILNLGNEEYNGIKFLSSNGKIYGLLVKNKLNNSTYAIYSITNNRYMMDFVGDSYTDMYDKSILEQGYFQYTNNNNLYIISQNDGSEIKKINDVSYLSSIKKDNNIIYRTYKSGFVCVRNENKLYDKNFNPITGNDIEYYSIVNSDNTITLVDNNNPTIFTVYDYNNKIYTSEEYKKIVSLVNDYIFILDDNDNLKLINIKGEEVATFPEIKEGYEILTNEAYNGIFDNRDTVYILLENEKIEYGEEGRYMRYDYYPNTQETKVVLLPGRGASICSH